MAISIQVLRVFANANRQEKQIKAKQISNKNIILNRSYDFFIWKVRKNLQIHIRRDFGRLLNQNSTYKNEMKFYILALEEDKITKYTTKKRVSINTIYVGIYLMKSKTSIQKIIK